MAEWRLLRGWTPEELRARLDAHDGARNFTETDEGVMTPAEGWAHYKSEAVIARGPDTDEHWARAREALALYQFSDPSIVTAHFDPDVPLAGRKMLLEVKVFALRYLCPAMVAIVEDTPDTFGYRYDTLSGHFEAGIEWFVITRDAAGDIRFRIEARWREGDFPNWWSRLGFRLLAGRYQRRWHWEAHRRISRLAHGGPARPPRRDRAGLTHQGVDVTFTWHSARKWVL